MREARICYDYVAAGQGVALLSGLYENELSVAGEHPGVTDKGRATFAAIGIEAAALERRRRPVCLHCLDWSERRHHLGGGLGAAILSRAIELDWIRRGKDRTLHMTTAGRSAFRSSFLDRSA